MNGGALFIIPNGPAILPSAPLAGQLLVDDRTCVNLKLTMTEFPVPLDNLIAYVKALHPDGGPLDNVADAFAVSARLDEQADALIGYFVDQARKSGASWSQIGAAMGVSKQAAQKRFVPGKAADLMPGGDRQLFSRFTPRAAQVLVAAGRLAAGQAGG